MKLRSGGGAHGLDRRPSQRIAKVVNILAWFEKYRTHPTTNGGSVGQFSPGRFPDQEIGAAKSAVSRPVNLRQPGRGDTRQDTGSLRAYSAEDRLAACVLPLLPT